MDLGIRIPGLETLGDRNAGIQMTTGASSGNDHT
jgi:hypothetical protein